MSKERIISPEQKLKNTWSETQDYDNFNINMQAFSFVP